MQIFYKWLYESENGRNRLKPLGKEKEFLVIIEGKSSSTKNKSQRLLIEAHKEIDEQIESIENTLSFGDMTKFTKSKKWNKKEGFNLLETLLLV